MIKRSTRSTEQYYAFILQTINICRNFVLSSNNDKNNVF
jgi:hypothetical protein